MYMYITFYVSYMYMYVAHSLQGSAVWGKGQIAEGVAAGLLWQVRATWQAQQLLL